MNMRTYGRRGLFTLGLLAAFVAAVGMAGCGHRCRHKHDPAERAAWVTKKIASKLDLNDAQKAKLEIVKEEILAQREKARQEREEEFRTVITQVRSERLDTGKLKALITRRHQRMEEAAPSVLQKIADFHASLTEIQREKAAKEIEKMHGRWR